MLTLALIGAVMCEVGVLSYGLFVVVPRTAAMTAASIKNALKTDEGKEAIADILLDVIDNLDVPALSQKAAIGAAPVISGLLVQHEPLIKAAVSGGVSKGVQKMGRRFSRDPIGTGLGMFAEMAFSQMGQGGAVPPDGSPPPPAPPSPGGVVRVPWGQ